MRIRPLSTLQRRVLTRAEVRWNEFERRGLMRERPLLESHEISGLFSGQTIQASIHPFAMFGHQLSSWISGYLWAADLGLDYAGGALTTDSHELFSQRAVLEQSMVRRTSRLPSVGDERNPRALDQLRNSVGSHLRKESTRGGRAGLRFALDQSRWDQIPAADVVRTAVMNGSQGGYIRDLEHSDEYVALHVRRPAFAGDISALGDPHRWVDIAWYVGIIEQIRGHRHFASTPIRVYALGEEAEFRALTRLRHVELRLNGDRDRDFAEMVAARLLIPGTSSFSFSAALASKGAIMCRDGWWHRLADDGRWAVAPSDLAGWQAPIDRLLAGSIDSS